MTQEDLILSVFVGLPVAVMLALFAMLVFADPIERFLERVDYRKHHPSGRGRK